MQEEQQIYSDVVKDYNYSGVKTEEVYNDRNGLGYVPIIGRLCTSNCYPLSTVLVVYLI